ncbi:glycosyltransferase [Ignatzschineria sp. LJL83]
MAGTEQVLTTLVSELEKKDIWTKGYFIYEPEDEIFLRSFSNYYSSYMPRILRRKHVLRPRALYKIVHRKGIERLFQEIEEDNLDILFVLKIEKEFLKNYSFFSKLKQKKPNLKLISWPHCSLDKMIDTESSFQEKLQIFDAHFAISDGIAEQLGTRLNQKKVFTVYNPVAIPRSSITRQYNKFIFIGRIDKDKRVVELINSLKNLKNENWTLDIIGSTGNREDDLLFNSFIHDSGLEDKIIFHGWKDDPWTMVNSAGLLLLNSTTEGFGLVLVEAMMRGIPCISTDCPIGPASIIKNDINGWLVNMDDDTELIDILDRILSKKLILPREDGIKISVDKFSVASVTRRFHEGLCEVLKY